MLHGTRILVLEDSPETQRALEVVLEQAGANVVTASTAQKALALIQVQSPDLIVSDVGLPEMTGYQFVSQLRELERVAKIRPVPALALTAFAGENTMRQALASGFHLALSKPIEPLQLITALAGLKADQKLHKPHQPE